MQSAKTFVKNRNIHRKGGLTIIIWILENS